MSVKTGPIADPPQAVLRLSRRDLLKALGGGMLVFVGAPTWVCEGQQGSPRRGGTNESDGQAQGGQGAPQEIAAWLHIAPDGKVTAFSGKVEVGQNARTSLAQAVAEELRVPLDSVVMVLGDTELCPYDQGTFGSRTTPAMMPILRRAAASAREALLDIAAHRLGVDRGDLRADNGRVFKASGPAALDSPGPASIAYGELAKDLPPEAAMREVALTPASAWKTLGSSAPKSGGRAIVTGKHEYTSDLKREGMLHAKVLRPPSLGATLVTADTSRAEALEGVRVVRDGSLVAVAAPTLRLAERALLEIEAEWKESPGPSNRDLFDILRGERAATDERPGGATYTCQYIAHAPLEPRAAVAEWNGTKLTVYTGTQRPFGVRMEVAQALGIPQDRVRVIVPDTGSGYGGKHSGEAAVEAARIARAVGRPVKLIWTRQEEFMFAYFRPAGVIELFAEVGANGLLTSWEHVNYNSGSAGIACPYAVANPRTQTRQARSPLRQGSYRALAATFNNFARESYMDELAHKVKADPLEFRLKNLRSERLAAVLNAAAERFGWPKKPSSSGIGVACGVEKGGYIATCAEVRADRASRRIEVLRVVSAFECGAIVNPEQLENQVEGAVLQGLGGALFEEIRFENGRILNGRLSAYRLPRFSDVPQMETILLDRKDLPPAGGGETPIIGIAPAIGNAVFDALGVRLRSLPLLSAEGW